MKFSKIIGREEADKMNFVLKKKYFFSFESMMRIRLFNQ